MRQPVFSRCLWGRMPSCAGIANPRAFRFPIGAQDTILPHGTAF